MESMATCQVYSGTEQLTILTWNLWVLVYLVLVYANGADSN